MKFLNLLAFIALAFSCSTNQTSSEATIWRLICLTPRGEVFYNSTASNVDMVGGATRFVPIDGPQAGSTIYTTMPCTFQSLTK